MGASSAFRPLTHVLVLARKGLIFTWSRKGQNWAGSPHLAKQNRVFHTMCCHAGFRWGIAGRRELTHGLGARDSSLGERLCGLYGLCRVFSLSVSLLFLFLLFAVLLNCPYPDPPVSTCFFPFSSAPRRGEEWLCGTFVAWCRQTITLNLVPNRAVGIMAGLSSVCQNNRLRVCCILL